MGRTVLIVKLAAIGDVVMALPMVNALRALDPGVHITWMGGRVVAPLLRHVEGVDEVVDVDETALLSGGAWRKGLGLLGAWRRVAGRHFDAVYVAHSDPRYKALVLPVRAGERHWLGSLPGQRGIGVHRHHGDAYAGMVARGGRSSPPAVRVDLDSELAAAITKANPQARPLVALAPGGARNIARENALRRWPLERYADLAARLHDDGCLVALVGDSGDEWTRQAFPAGRVVDLIGRTSLPQLVAVFRRCAAVVMHDSGPMHLARLAGARVVALLGPTPPAMFFRPGDAVRVLWPGEVLPCAPCYDGVEFADCAYNACMRMIDCADVLAQVRGAIAEAGRSGLSEPRAPPA